MLYAYIDSKNKLELRQYIDKFGYLYGNSYQFNIYHRCQIIHITFAV